MEKLIIELKNNSVIIDFKDYQNMSLNDMKYIIFLLQNIKNISDNGCNSNEILNQLKNIINVNNKKETEITKKKSKI